MSQRLQLDTSTTHSLTRSLLCRHSVWPTQLIKYISPYSCALQQSILHYHTGSCSDILWPISILNLFLGSSSLALLEQRSYVVLMDPVGDLVFVGNRKKPGVFRSAEIACQWRTWCLWQSGFSWDSAQVDIGLAKLRVQFDERSVSLRDTVDRLRFREKERVVYMVTTTVQERSRNEKEAFNEMRWTTGTSKLV